MERNTFSQTATAVQLQATQTMWRHLASSTYLSSKAPSLALFHLLILAAVSVVGSTLIASVIGLLALPFLAIAYGSFERWRLRQLGYAIKDGHVLLNKENPLEWAKFRLQEAATWRETGVVLVSIITGGIVATILILEFALWGTLFGVGIAGLMGYDTSNLQFSLNLGSDSARFFEEVFGSIPGLTYSPNIQSQYWWVFILAAVLILPVFFYISGLLAAATASLNALILSPRPQEYERQVARLSESRIKIVDAFETERRRIERDLHDGVQQELVNVSMRLGLAEMEAKTLNQQGTPVESLLNHVSAARAQLAHAQKTLRNTVRGIYPAVLEDHGLKAALEELAHNCALPVHLTYYAQPVRMAPEIERTSYFAASEAITNTLKHAQASEIQLDVREVTGYLQVTVSDNGIGGANLAKGTGLVGLTERAQALGGSLNIFTQQPGETIMGTTVQLKLPIS